MAKKLQCMMKLREEEIYFRNCLVQAKVDQEAESHSLEAGPLELILNLNTGSATFDTFNTLFDLSEPQFLPTFVRWG